ncbi:MAG: hypothetical protein CMJ78_26550 [Planctomycetaceae bacterium]|nr:hypothetical protein [Planctomycetaceae bacterium]
MSRRLLSVGLLICTLLCTNAKSEPLRYSWKPETHAAYDVKIVADEPTTKTTLAGLIEYTIGKDGKIRYAGGLKKSVKKKANHPDNRRRRGPFGSPFGPGRIGPPRIPSPFTRKINPFKGTEHTTNNLEFDSRGHLLSIKGSSQLPYMIGHLSILPFERLPEGDETEWKEEVGIVLSEAKEKIVSTRPFGIPSPFDPRPSNEPEKKTSGGQWTEYKIAEDKDGLVAVDVTSLLHPATKDGKDSLRIEGSGKWFFNRTLQLPESLDFKHNIIVESKNNKLTVPVTIVYRRLNEKEWDKILADRAAAEKKRIADAKRRKEEADREAAEAKRMAEAPLTDGELAATLKDLKSASAVEVINRLKKLAGKSPKNPEKEVALAVQPLLKHSNADVRTSAQQAYAKYSPEYKKEYDLLQRYRKGESVPQPSFLLPKDVKLPLGLIVVCQETRDRKWYPAKVTGQQDDGNVTFKYTRWPHRDGKRLLTSLRLPDRRVDQPQVDASVISQLYGTPSAELLQIAMRIWTDKSGGFRVDAKYVRLDGDNVFLELKNGKKAKIPLEKLSEDDQKYVKLLQKKSDKPANPFEIVD